MTRLPTESRAVQGVDGDPYELSPICATPGCLSASQEAHHLWRRSELIGPWWYVHIDEDDVIVGNVVGLCEVHHHAVTVNAAWIKWVGDHYEWTDMMRPSAPLSFQPPVRNAQGGLAEDEVHLWNEENLQTPEQVQADGTCPTCLRPLPHPKKEHEPKRMRRTWSITVPADERENGAEMLSVLLEEGRREMAQAGLPYGSEETANYFVLSTMLGLFVQHADEILSDA